MPVVQPPLPHMPPTLQAVNKDAQVLRDFARLCRASVAHEDAPNRKAAEVVLHGAAQFAESIADQIQRGHITVASAADTLEATHG